jgi:hypothetical protein
MVSPLDRPDTLALAAAVAAGGGDDLGEIDLEVVPDVTRRGGVLPGGLFVLADPSEPQKRLELLRTDPLRAGDHVVAKLPAGSYRVSYEASGFRSVGGVTVRVVRKQLASVRLSVVPDSLAQQPGAPPPAEPPSP